jgi:hypothetical protein
MGLESALAPFAFIEVAAIALDQRRQRQSLESITPRLIDRPHPVPVRLSLTRLRTPH